MAKFKLPRVKQCEGCPWKKSVDINTIPNGYDYEAHDKLLALTKPNDISNLDKQQAVMACHHSNDNDNMFCIGYLYNQLGIGNNITLRIKMMSCENVKYIKVEGEQHEQFSDLVPKTI